MDNEYYKKEIKERLELLENQSGLTFLIMDNCLQRKRYEIIVELELGDVLLFKSSELQQIHNYLWSLNVLFNNCKYAKKENNYVKFRKRIN